jgi:hypothetical protein
LRKVVEFDDLRLRRDPENLPLEGSLHLLHHYSMETRSPIIYDTMDPRGEHCYDILRLLFV